AQRVDMQRTGKEPVHKGNRANSGEPLSMVFETAKGHLALAINEEHQFAKFAAVIDRENLPLDVRFATRDQRRLHAEALQAIVQEALRERAALAWEAKLNRAGVAASSVRTLAESLAHPGAQADPMLFALERGMLPPRALTPPAPYAKTPTTKRAATTLSAKTRVAIAASVAPSVDKEMKKMTKGVL
ncbi:MAG: CoA transferase, partial [Casimicrobium sp.]